MFCNGYNPLYTNPKVIGPGGCVCDIKCENFKPSVGIDILSIEVKTILEWIPQRLADGQSRFAKGNGLVHELWYLCLHHASIFWITEPWSYFKDNLFADICQIRRIFHVLYNHSNYDTPSYMNIYKKNIWLTNWSLITLWSSYMIST